MESGEGLSTAVVATVKSSSLAELAGEYAEIGLDSALSEGTLRDIPIVNSIVAVAKVGLSIHDRLFTKKLLRFLIGLSQLSPEDRASMVERLDAEDGFRHQVGDRIIELLDRIDSHLKPEMVAKAFQAYAVGTINADMLNRLNVSIERLPHYEIKHVRLFYTSIDARRNEMSIPTLGALVAAGLAKLTTGWDELGYDPTEVCKVFVELNLDQSV